MAYKIIYKIDNNMYTEGSPVILSKGIIYKESETGEVIGAVNIFNISDKVIDRVDVIVDAFDKDERTLPPLDTLVFDVISKPGTSFGPEKTFKLDDKTEFVKIKIIKVVFFDNTEWIPDTKAEWEPCPKQKSAKRYIGSRKEYKAYKIYSSVISKYVPLKYKDIWLCSCGFAAAQGSPCAKCGSDYDQLMSLLQLDDEGRINRPKSDEPPKKKYIKVLLKGDDITDAMRENGKISKFNIFLLSLIALLVIAVGALSLTVAKFTVPGTWISDPYYIDRYNCYAQIIRIIPGDKQEGVSIIYNSVYDTVMEVDYGTYKISSFVTKFIPESADLQTDKMYFDPYKSEMSGSKLNYTKTTQYSRFDVYLAR